MKFRVEILYFRLKDFMLFVNQVRHDKRISFIERNIRKDICGCSLYQMNTLSFCLIYYQNRHGRRITFIAQINFSKHEINLSSTKRITHILLQMKKLPYLNFHKTSKSKSILFTIYEVKSGYAFEYHYLKILLISTLFKSRLEMAFIYLL